MHRTQLEDQVGVALEAVTGASVPTTQTTLIGRIRSVAESRVDPMGMRFVQPAGGDLNFSALDLLRWSAPLADRIAARARRLPPVASGALPPGIHTPVLIAAMEPLPTVLMFLAALQAGATPLILPPPQALGGEASFAERTALVADPFGGRCILATDERLRSTPAQVAQRLVVTDAFLSGPEAAATSGPSSPMPVQYRRAEPGDIAFLQMTSASTGDGRLVAISHQNILTNLDGIRHSLRCGPDERMCSWLPLYHDMGLVGTLLLSLVQGFGLSLMSPSAFIRRPARWLQAISDHRATITTAPNFGYDYARQRVLDVELVGVDLSCLRATVIGAEPVRKATLAGFAERFARHGFRAHSFTPSFGLAESTLATSMHPPGEPAWYAVVEPVALTPGSRVPIRGHALLDAFFGEDDPGDDENAGGSQGGGTESGGTQSGGIPVFSLGRPLPDLDLALVDDDGTPVTDEQVLGEIVLSGPSVCAGAFGSAAEGFIPTGDGPLATGDLGFRFRGDVFVLERKKHLIIRFGRNYLASLIEDRIAEIIGHPVHNVMVLDLDITDPASPVCAVLESYPEKDRLTEARRRALRTLELPIDRVLISRRRIIPRTTSGKKQYHLCRQLARAGRLSVEKQLDLTP